MNIPAPAPLVLEFDEFCTVVCRQDHRLWIWLAMDRVSRRIVGCFFGQRDAPGAFGLWQSLPIPYLEAVCHTDRLAAYKSVVFGGLHQIGGTQHLERFNATLRAKIPFLVRNSLSFCRQQANLELLVWLVIHGYNASLP